MKLVVRSLEFNENPGIASKRDTVLFDSEKPDRRADPPPTLDAPPSESLVGPRIRTFVHRRTGETIVGTVQKDRVAAGDDVIPELQGVRCWVVRAYEPPSGDQVRVRVLNEREWAVGDPL